MSSGEVDKRRIFGVGMKRNGKLEGFLHSRDEDVLKDKINEYMAKGYSQDGRIFKFQKVREE